MTDKPFEFFEGTEMPTAGWWEALWPNPGWVIAAVGIDGGMDVIDLCCGDGWFTLHTAKVARRVIAVDIDPEILQVAQHRLTQAAIYNCDFVVGNAYRLQNLAPRNVDFVFMANAFHGVHDKPRLVRAVSAVLKAGGRFAIVNWHQRPREETTVLGEPRGPSTGLRLSPEQTMETVEAGGLTLVRRMEIPPYHYGLVFGQGRISGTTIEKASGLTFRNWFKLRFGRAVRVGRTSVLNFSAA